MKLKKKKGNLEFFTASLLLFFVPILIIYNMRMETLKFTKNYVEDGLVSSLLASATIDLRVLAESKQIINNNYDKSFKDFSETLKENLNLDDNYYPKSKRLITDTVKIDDFVIYNVLGNDIQTVRKSNGIISTSIITNGLGNLKTPDGVQIKTTTIYAKISFKVKGYLNDEYKVSKEKSVDVTN